AALSVVLLVFGIEEPARTAAAGKARPSLRDAGRLNRGVWNAIAVASILTFAKFSEAFLILRAQGLGIEVTFAPAVIVLLNLVHSIRAYPIGVLSDRLGRERMLTAGLLCLVAA